MKLYIGFLKKDVMERAQVSSSIIVTLPELDFLIEGESIEKLDEAGKPYKLSYNDFRMIISNECEGSVK